MDAKNTTHCMDHFSEREKRSTCYNCGAPLTDNQLVKDSFNMNTVNSWAHSQLQILADMAEDRGMDWFSEKAKKIAMELRTL